MGTGSDIALAPMLEGYKSFHRYFQTLKKIRTVEDVWEIPIILRDGRQGTNNTGCFKCRLDLSIIPFRKNY